MVVGGLFAGRRKREIIFTASNAQENNQILRERRRASISSHKDFHRNYFLPTFYPIYQNYTNTKSTTHTHESSSGCRCVLTFLCRPGPDFYEFVARLHRET